MTVCSALDETDRNLITTGMWIIFCPLYAESKLCLSLAILPPSYFPFLKLSIINFNLFIHSVLFLATTSYGEETSTSASTIVSARVVAYRYPNDAAKTEFQIQVTADVEVTTTSDGSSNSETTRKVCRNFCLLLFVLFKVPLMPYML